MLDDLIQRDQQVSMIILFHNLFLCKFLQFHFFMPLRNAQPRKIIFVLRLRCSLFLLWLKENLQKPFLGHLRRPMKYTLQAARVGLMKKFHLK